MNLKETLMEQSMELSILQQLKKMEFLYDLKKFKLEIILKLIPSLEMMRFK